MSTALSQVQRFTPLCCLIVTVSSCCTYPPCVVALPLARFLAGSSLDDVCGLIWSCVDTLMPCMGTKPAGQGQGGAPPRVPLYSTSHVRSLYIIITPVSRTSTTRIYWLLIALCQRRSTLSAEPDMLARLGSFTFLEQRSYKIRIEYRRFARNLLHGTRLISSQACNTPQQQPPPSHRVPLAAVGNVQTLSLLISEVDTQDGVTSALRHNKH